MSKTKALRDVDSWLVYTQIKFKGETEWKRLYLTRVCQLMPRYSPDRTKARKHRTEEAAAYAAYLASLKGNSVHNIERLHEVEKA